MPFPTFKKGVAPPPPDDSFLTRIGGLPGLAAAGTRALTGVASAEGGLPGALISGAGELGAETLEGSIFKQSPLRTAGRVTAAGVTGAIPFGAVLKEGRPIASAIRGAAYSGGGEALREAAATNEVDPGTVLKSAATGGALTGGLSALMKWLGGKPPVEPSGPPPVEIQPTIPAEPGRTVLSGGTIDKKGTLVKAKRVSAEKPIKPVEPSGQTIGVHPPSAPKTPTLARVPYNVPEPPTTARPGFIVGPTGEAVDARNVAPKDLNKFQTWLSKRQTDAAKAEAVANKQSAIDTAIREGKLKPGASKVSKSVSVTTDKGTTTMRTPYKAPKQEGDTGGDISDLADMLGAGGTRTPAPKGPTDWRASVPEVTTPPGLVKVPPPPEGTFARGIYDKHIATGASHGAAVARTEDEIRATAGQMGVSPKELALSPAEGHPPPSALVTSASPTVNPVAAAEAITEPVTARYAFEQPGVGPMYHIVGGPSDKSTVSAAQLGKMGIPVPEAPAAAGAIGAPVSPAEAPPSSPLARFFKSRLEAAGQGYGDIKAAKAAGEQVPEEGRALAGRLAQQERIAAGLPPPTKAAPAIAEPVVSTASELADYAQRAGKLDELAQLLKAQPTEPPVATPVGPTSAADLFGKPAATAPKTPLPASAVLTPEELAAIAAEPAVPAMPPDKSFLKMMKALAKKGYTPEQIAEMSADDAAIALGKTPKTPKPTILTTEGGAPRLVKKPGEAGEIDPMLLARLGLGAGGALVGAATNPLGNRLASAVAGGAIGAAAPSAVKLLSEMGAHPDAIQNLDQQVQTNGIEATATKIWHALPQIQRFNYLTSGIGLPANAVVGPYGSAVMGALEHGLSGDPRGWALLRSLSPVTFMKEYMGSMERAKELLAGGEMGRAENVTLERGAPYTKQIMARPGLLMVMGDETARKFIQAAGFSEEEARRMTLTLEPEFPLSKSVVNLGRGSVFGNILAPFRRTPTNIAEQGAERLPLLGSLVQSARKVPDPVERQIVQQAILSPAVMGLSGAIGYGSEQLDPDFAKVARRYVTNFGGQYSLPAALGYAAGQAVSQGKPAFSAANLRPAIEALPLPTTEPMVDLAKFLFDPSVANIPAGAIPGVLREPPFNIGKAQPAATLPKLRNLPRIRRR